MSLPECKLWEIVKSIKNFPMLHKAFTYGITIKDRVLLNKVLWINF